jgi:hypothetical protein
VTSTWIFSNADPMPVEHASIRIFDDAASVRNLIEQLPGFGWAEGAELRNESGKSCDIDNFDPVVENQTKKSHGAAARSILAGLLLIACFTDYGNLRNRSANGSGEPAFIVYWQHHPVKDHRLRLAVKDNIDIKGLVTTAGCEYVANTSSPAARDAECLAIPMERDVRIVGKTNLSEFAIAPSGLNEYFGTPENPLIRQDFIPGGSFSGSAVAVAWQT